MGQSFAFLGAFVVSAILSIVLAYIARITALKAALNLWSLGYALNGARLLVYAVAGVPPPQAALFFLAEGFQTLQSLALLFGVLFLAGRPVSLARHALPAALGALLLLALTGFFGGDGLLRIWPSYVVSAGCLLLAGIEVARSGRTEDHTGSAFTAVVLILWGLHKLDFLLLAGGPIEIAQLRFMASAAFYTAAALGFAIMALTHFHRRLSRSLAENEAHFRKMFEDAPVGYQSLDEEGRVVAVNRQWLDILGYAPDEVIGRSFADFLAPSSRPKFPPRFAQFKKIGVTKDVEFEMLRKDGREMLGSFEGRINPGAEPGTLRTHCMLTDVTEKRRKEALVTRLGRIIDQSFNEVFVFDAETLKFLHVNKGGLANLGYSPEELHALTPLDIKLDFTRERFEALIAPLRSGEQETLLFETRHRRKDGTVYDVEIRLQLMGEEIPPVFAAVVRDITAWKQAETALREREGLLQGLMEHSPSSIYVKDLQGRFILVNREFERRNRIAATDAIGKTSHDLQPAPQADDAVRRERLALGEGKVNIEEIEVDSPDGETRAYLSAKFPIFDAGGRFLGTGSVSTDITANKRAEQALRLSESRLQAILDHAPAEISHKDREGRYLLANDAYLRRRGVTAEDILGKTIFDIAGAAEAQEIRAQDEEVMATGQARSYQGVRERVSGGKGTFAIVRFPLFDDKGKVSSVGVISIDVTREQRAEQALRDNEERLRLVLESTGEGIYAVDLEGRCTLCNPAAARILGYDDPDALLGRDIHAMIHHSHADGRPYPLAECPAHRAVASKAPVYVDDEVFWRRDGRSIPVAFRSNPVVRNGEVVGTVVSFSDIGERKRAEAWLLRLSQSVEQSPFGIAITDAQGRVEYANPSFCRETGYTFSEIAGKTMSSRNADGPGSASDNEILSTLADGGMWRGEVRHRRRNGEAYWVSLLVSPIRERNGRTVAFVAISEDITDRRRMADHLRQAQKMEAVGQLTGGIAHDFNNILSVILTCAECLADDLQGDAVKMPLVASIVRSVHRAADLTHRLLALSRRQDLKPEVLDLSAVMQDMVELLRRSLGETIAVSVEAAAGLPPVLIDRGQFENALLNLALNARDAMPEGGSLTIGVARGEPPVSADGGRGGRKGGFVCVSVSDNGTGMTPDVLERVFEPFFTTKGKGQGTGLGLSMVYGFVRQSGGDIVVDSVENEGTTFRLYLPAAGDTVMAPPDRRKGRPIAEDSLPPLVIVLAEDDAGVRTATKFILESTGHSVFAAVNGVEALEILRRTPKVDLLVTDVIMPGGLSGRDLAREAARLIPSLKILFTSGYADGYLSTGDIVAGMSVFVPKPYTKEILIGAIRSLGFGGAPHIWPESEH